MSTTDPLPLRPAEMKPVGTYNVSFRLDGPPDVAGARAVLEGVGKRESGSPTTAACGSGVGANVLAWSFDGECLVFPWPIHQGRDDETVLRKLDVTAAEAARDGKHTRLAPHAR